MILTCHYLFVASLPSVVGRVFSTKGSELDQLGSVDHGYENDRIDKVAEPEKRAFTYLMMTSMKFAYASTARLLVVRLLSSISPSAEVLALAFEIGRASCRERVLVAV